MQFTDLAKQYEKLKRDIDAAIQAVLSHGRYIMGPEVFELEKRLAEYIGVRHCITCSSGTSALLMSLMALNIGAGDAVFTSTFTFAATAEAIALTGATPVFVDIDEDSFNIDAQKLEAAAAKMAKEGRLKPKAVIPVDLFGLPADYDAIRAVAEKYVFKIIEDAAQGFGGRYNGRRAGALGDIGCTSFFPSKPLGCYGDGGAVFTDDDAIAELIRSIRMHGQGANKYDNVRIGLNARLDTIQAAVLLPKLTAFKQYELDLRNRAAALYTSRLADVVKTPHVPANCLSSWAQYSILTQSPRQRAKLQSALKEKGIPSMIYYPKPLHLQNAYSNGYVKGDFPVAESVAERILSLPMHPYLSEEDIESVCSAVKIGAIEGQF